METNRINYKITFLSDWHAGSGLSAGAEADLVVIKDKNNLPYLPGKTIKGLIRDVFEDFKDWGHFNVNEEFIYRIFGKETLKEENGHLTNKPFFSNAVLPDEEKNEIINNSLSSFLYRNISSTKINKNGVADEGSLRTLEVCIPLTLNGYIDNIKEQDIEMFEKAFQYLRNIGTNRNRGLGRCKIERI